MAGGIETKPALYSPETPTKNSVDEMPSPSGLGFMPLLFSFESYDNFFPPRGFSWESMINWLR
jgi:hypothetical protein